MSKIEWTEKTWNPVAGCTKVSPGCQNCYAERMAHRLAFMGKEGYAHVTTKEGKWNGNIYCHFGSRLEIPLHWKKPRMIFVCSMSDLFHPSVPFEFIDKVIETTEVTPWHTYQILTKRPERMLEYFKWRFNNADQHTLDNTKAVQWRASHNIENTSLVLPNLWLGTTAENQEMADKRIPILLQIPAAVRFVSIEPCLSSVDLRPYFPPIVTVGENHQLIDRPKEKIIAEQQIHQVIVGGESGPKARPMHPQWVHNIRNQCQAAGVPFFFKQWGGWEPYDVKKHGKGKMKWTLVPKDKSWDEKFGDYMKHHGLLAQKRGMAPMVRTTKKKAGRLLDGKEHSEYPKGGE